MLGRATFTTVMSSTIMSWAHSTTARVMPRPPRGTGAGRAGAGRDCAAARRARCRGGMQEVGTGFLPGTVRRAYGTAGWPRAPGRATMYSEDPSGNYTEDPSGLQT